MEITPFQTFTSWSDYSSHIDTYHPPSAYFPQSIDLLPPWKGPNYIFGLVIAAISIFICIEGQGGLLLMRFFPSLVGLRYLPRLWVLILGFRWILRFLLFLLGKSDGWLFGLFGLGMFLSARLFEIVFNRFLEHFFLLFLTFQINSICYLVRILLARLFQISFHFLVLLVFTTQPSWTQPPHSSPFSAEMPTSTYSKTETPVSFSLKKWIAFYLIKVDFWMFRDRVLSFLVPVFDNELIHALVVGADTV